MQKMVYLAKLSLAKVCVVCVDELFLLCNFVCVTVKSFIQFIHLFKHYPLPNLLRDINQSRDRRYISFIPVKSFGAAEEGQICGTIP